MRSFLGASKSAIYFEVQHHPLSLSERDVVALLDQSRLDPRLMEVMTEFVRDFWWNMIPEELNKAAKKSKFPFMIKVATGAVLNYCKMAPDDKTAFVEWLRIVVRGIKNPAPQLLYVGIIPVGSRLAAEEVESSLPTFVKHNVFSKDLPFNKGKPGILKTEKNPPKNSIDALDLLKRSLAKKIKDLKFLKGFSNEKIIAATGINRVFLSNIMNNKLQKITVEYLRDHVAQLN